MQSIADGGGGQANLTWCGCCRHVPPTVVVQGVPLVVLTLCLAAAATATAAGDSSPETVTAVVGSTTYVFYASWETNCLVPGQFQDDAQNITRCELAADDTLTNCVAIYNHTNGVATLIYSIGNIFVDEEEVRVRVAGVLRARCGGVVDAEVEGDPPLCALALRGPCFRAACISRERSKTRATTSCPLTCTASCLTARG